MPHSIHSPVESGTRLPIPWPALGPSQETGCLWPGSPQAGSESGVGEPASALLEEKKEPQARLTSPQGLQGPQGSGQHLSAADTPGELSWATAQAMGGRGECL